MDIGEYVRQNGVVIGRSILRVAVGAVCGALTWTATEYTMHRWVLHGPFGKGRLKHLPIGSLHRAHHGDPLSTSLAARSAGHASIAGVAALASVALSAIAPVAAARVGAAVWSAGYSSYEINHWNFHHRSARTAWGRRQRDRHHRHHYGAPASNLGVTMSFWDHALGTEAPPATATINE